MSHCLNKLQIPDTYLPIIEVESDTQNNNVCEECTQLIHQTYQTMLETEIQTCGRVKPIHDENLLRTRQKLRDFVINVYKQIAKSLNINKTLTGINSSVIHICVTYIDIILSNHQVSKPEYKLLALSCLSIAAKFEEDDPNLPLAHEFIKFSGLKIDRKIFIQKEGEILQKYLNWDLNVTTVYHFAQSLISMGIIFTNDTVKGSQIGEKQLKYMKKRVMFFVDLSSECNKLRKNILTETSGFISSRSKSKNKLIFNDSIKFTPSIIAVACIICARKMSKFDNLWNPKLTEFTGYQDPFKIKGVLKDCFELMWEFYVETYKFLKQQQSERVMTQRAQRTQNSTNNIQSHLNTARNQNSKLKIPNLNLNSLNFVKEKFLENKNFQIKSKIKKLDCNKCDLPLQITQRSNIRSQKEIELDVNNKIKKLQHSLNMKTNRKHQQSYCPSFANSHIQKSERNQCFKPLLRSKSVKEKIRGQNSQIHKTELFANASGRGRSTNHFLVKKNMALNKKSKALVNLESAIHKNIPEMFKKRTHNRSVAGSKSYIHHNMSKDVIGPPKIDISSILNTKSNGGCLTERNNFSRDKANNPKISLKSKNFNLKLSKGNLQKVRSLKNKTRQLRKNSYENINASKPKIRNDTQIPKIFRKIKKEIPILKIASDQKWQQYSVKELTTEFSNGYVDKNETATTAKNIKKRGVEKYIKNSLISMSNMIKNTSSRTSRKKLLSSRKTAKQNSSKKKSKNKISLLNYSKTSKNSQSNIYQNFSTQDIKQKPGSSYNPMFVLPKDKRRNLCNNTSLKRLGDSSVFGKNQENVPPQSLNTTRNNLSQCGLFRQRSTRNFMKNMKVINPGTQKTDLESTLKLYCDDLGANSVSHNYSNMSLCHTKKRKEASVYYKRLIR
ncbi:unnamed protein product [Moneuplotes crassus]|uniref:Cyclin-like domain-containing protein n=1 Tax=Euplotes crassus TaxID=5936 RepID=A0AAD1XZ16_EUPCR|nr:unnamed protein product [Moneuplotes crassus]